MLTKHPDSSFSCALLFSECASFLSRPIAKYKQKRNPSLGQSEEKQDYRGSFVGDEEEQDSNSDCRQKEAVDKET